ncbi:MAG: hypothetical protein IJE59_02850 [Clostridia bacterium]|nr:hypothetical protein [Clostridia bacterium]
MIAITKDEEKQEVVVRLIELMKKTDITNAEKESIYNIVMNMTSRTINQKIRFIMLYGLKPTEFKKYTLTEIAKLQKCSVSAIRFSTIAVKNKFWCVPDDEFKIIKAICEKYQ